MCIVVSAYPQKHQPSLFFAKPLINQKIFKAPSPSPSSLANLSLYTFFFAKLSNIKFFSEPQY